MPIPTHDFGIRILRLMVECESFKHDDWLQWIIRVENPCLKFSLILRTCILWGSRLKFHLFSSISSLFSQDGTRLLDSSSVEKPVTSTFTFSRTGCECQEPWLERVLGAPFIHSCCTYGEGRPVKSQCQAWRKIEVNLLIYF